MRGGVVLKFFNRELPERGLQLQRGEFYCGPLRDFQNDEIEKKKSFINDPMEGEVVTDNPYYGLLKGEIGEHKYLCFTHPSMNNVGICCFVHLDLNRDFVVDCSGSALIAPRVIEQLRQSFSDKAAVIWSEGAFIDVIHGIKIIDKKDICYANYGLVNYVADVGARYAQVHGKQEETLDFFLTKVVYQKRLKFKFQREFRIAALYPNISSSRKVLISQAEVQSAILPNFESLKGIALENPF
ncbi:MAG: hypothetical protein LKG24_00435 [Lacticaseibacillus songhuajiangensis]|jgi:hypothetical protein|nr:hypothetical protein [Lacticaseibacillus songhuajiangensis]